MTNEINQQELVDKLSQCEGAKLEQFDFDPYAFSIALTFDNGKIIMLTANKEKQLQVEIENTIED